MIKKHPSNRVVAWPPEAPNEFNLNSGYKNISKGCTSFISAERISFFEQAVCGSLQLNCKLICLSQSLIRDIHVPTLHLLFHPQLPVLTHHERLSPTLPSSSHSSKVTPINFILQLLHHTVKSFLSITASTKSLHCISIPHLKEMMVSHLKSGCCVWQM